MSDTPDPRSDRLPESAADLSLPGGLDGLLSQGGLEGLLSQAVEMQQQLSAAQEALADTVVKGQAGGGAVVVEVTAGLEFRSVRIRPDAVDPGDVEMLQDLVLAALHDAVAAIGDAQQQSMGGLGAAFGLGGPVGIDDDDEDDEFGDYLDDDGYDDDDGDDDDGLDEPLVDPGGEPRRG